MESFIIFVHVLVAIGITGLVLIQHGKGADMGASFGGGASQTIFGSVGSGNVLTKSTSLLATIFFATSLVLALIAKQQSATGVQDSSLILNPDVLNEVPAAVSDVPVVESVSSDVPLTDTEEQAAVAADDVPAAQDEVDQEAAAADAEASAEPAEEPVQ